MNITINLKNLTINLVPSVQQKQPDVLDALFAAMFAAGPCHTAPTTDTPTTDTPTTDTPTTDTPTTPSPAPAPAAQYVWPGRGDNLVKFNSAKNVFDGDPDLSEDDLPEVIEVTDDWFRVHGDFTSKRGKGTREVTLKVSRDEVASGAVTFTIS